MNDNFDEENYAQHKKRTERMLKWGVVFCVVLFLILIYVQLAGD